MDVEEGIARQVDAGNELRIDYSSGIAVLARRKRRSSVDDANLPWRRSYLDNKYVK